MAKRGLSTYEDWLHCIVELCQIKPTPEYVAARINELRNERDFGTKKFVESWGDEHRVRVLGWFERLGRELGEAQDATSSPGGGGTTAPSGAPSSPNHL